MRKLLKLDFDTVIPGHGNDPLTKADVQAFKQIDTLMARASELFLGVLRVLGGGTA